MSEVQTENGQGTEQQQRDLEVAFDADARAADRAKKGYRVGGIVYQPRKKTGKLVKEIIEMAPTEAIKEDDREGQLAGVDLLYQQVAKLLLNADDENPDWERLMDELDIEEAREMVGPLMGNRPGNAPSPAS